MRLTRLDLLCYGAFENRSLPLRPDAKLHVVYGANEAGKSTTLSAVTDLLFGFPTRTTQDFRFRQTELRVGGEILSRGGARLPFVRRKGNKNTLLDLEGKPLPDDALSPYLGQMTREVFCRAFGLDAELLRAGAEELLQANGEMGSSLMAAASGLRGLTTLRKTLDEEAEAIFAPKKSKDRRFYQASDRFEQAKKAIRDLELGANAWKALQERIAQGTEKLEALAQEQRQVRAGRARIARLKALVPLVRRIDAQQAALAADAGLPSTPAGFAAELGAALMQAAEASRVLASAKADQDDSARALDAIAIDAALLDRAGEIEVMMQRIGKHQKDNVDLPRVAADHDGAQAELDRLARMLGLADARALIAAQPTQAALALVRSLAQEGQANAQRQANFEHSLREETEGLEALDSQQARQGHLADPAPLREKLNALGNVEALAAAREQKAQALRREEEALRQDAANLSPPVDDLARLTRAAIPTVDAIASFETRFEQASQASRDATRRLADAVREIEATKTKLEALAAGGDVPTPERIAAARAARDTEWSALRPVLFGETGGLTGAALAASVTRFEVASAQADALADAATRDATRVADYAALSAALARQIQTHRAIEHACEEQKKASEALAAEWTALWSGVGISPLAPSAMSAWRSSLRSLLERHARLDDLRADLRAAEADLAALTGPLDVIAREAALPAMEIDPVRQSARIEARLKELATAWDEARTTARRREDIKVRIAKLQRDLSEESAKQSVWDRRWRAALPTIGLGPEAGPAEALGALDVWKGAPSAIEKRADLARRVTGLQRDIAVFEADARALVEALAPDLAGQAPAAALIQLSRRLERTRGDQARRDELAKRRAACDEAVAKAEREAQSATSAIETIARELPPGSDLDELHARLTRRERLVSALEDLRRQLAEQAEGQGEDAIRAELATFDPDRADIDLSALARDEERLTQVSNETYAALSDDRRKAAAYESGIGSEAAWQQRVNAEAEMQEAAREWIVLRLATTMLDGALEAHRAARQDPLMERASAIFSALTGGAFAGIAQTFDDADVAVLQGRRSTSELVPLAGLSEGTRDQLYLALRLAYVEDYAARAEPVPFIADDLFTSFDDGRTVNGLKALAGASEHLQCILFTHHRHVAELARAELGAAADILEL